MFPLELNSPSLKRKLMMSGLGSDLINKITRYIATLKASDGGYIRLPQLLSVGANQTFELEFNVSSSQMATYFVANKEDATGENRLVFNASGALYGCGVSAITPSNTSWLEDGKVNNVVFSRNESGSLSLKVNDNILLNTSAVNGVPFKFDTLFSKWAGITSSNNLNGSPLLFKCTVDGQLTHHYDFNVAKGTTIIPNLAQPLGSELVDFTIATGRSAALTDISTNAVTVTNNIAEYGTTEQIIDFEKGTYLLQVKSSDNSAHSSGGAFTVTPNNWTDKIYHSSLQNGDNTLIFNVPSAGSYKIWFHVGANNLGESQIFSDVSIKKAPHWAEYINVTDDNKSKYEWDAERNAWVGVDNAGITFNGVSQYASISMPTSIGDVVRFKIIASGSGAGARVMLASGPTSGNHIYFIGTTINLDGGRFTAKVNGSDVIPGITQIPMDGAVYEFELTSNGNYDVNFVASKSDNFYCDFPIFDLSLNDGSVYNFPMDDLPTTNPTMRNIGSGSDGTYVGLSNASYNMLEVAQ